MAFSIVLKDLSKEFGEFIALHKVSAEIQEGERIALFGHNGAGKTTLLNIVATLTKPTSGEIAYFQDRHPIVDKPAIRALIAYQSHEAMLYPDLTAGENLAFVARLYGRRTTPADIGELLATVGMDHAAHKLFRECSRGMQQRLSLARTLLVQPRVLLLDEPFAGLDVEGTERLRSFLEDRQRSWMMVTHDPDMAYALADRFWILKNGRLVRDLAKESLSLEAFTGLCRKYAAAGIAL